MAGHFAQALALLDDTATGQPGRTGHRFTADEATALLAAAGFELGSVHGVRVFADLVPGSLLDLEPGATAALSTSSAPSPTAPSTSRSPHSCICWPVADKQVVVGLGSSLGASAMSADPSLLALLRFAPPRPKVTGQRGRQWSWVPS